MVNPEEIVPHTLRRLRAAAMENEQAEQVLSRVESFEAIEDYLSAKEPLASAASSVLVERYLVKGETLNLVSMVASFGSPEDVTAQTIQIELFFPDDEQSEQTLGRLDGLETPTARS